MQIGTPVRFKVDETGGAWGEIITIENSTYTVKCYTNTEEIFQLNSTDLRPMTLCDYAHIRINSMNQDRAYLD